MAERLYQAIWNVGDSSSVAAEAMSRLSLIGTMKVVLVECGSVYDRRWLSDGHGNPSEKWSYVFDPAMRLPMHLRHASPPLELADV